MKSTEVWKPVVGYEGWYEVSSQGRVKSLERVFARGAVQQERIMRAHIQRGADGKAGRVTAALCVAGKPRTHLVHHLVLEAFVGPRPDGLEACHWDGDAANNAVENLRWDTHVANEQDKKRHGTNYESKKTHCPRNHPLSAPNLAPSEARLGRRKCQACTLAYLDAYRCGGEVTQEAADEKYALVLAGRVGEKRETCPYGHSLIGPNLVPSSLKLGLRGCLVCSRARGFAKYRELPFDEAVADERYAVIMQAE